MEYDFLIDTYDTERIKTLSVWSMFMGEDLRIRPHPLGKSDRNPLEHMVHQCLGEAKWFHNMFGIDVSAASLPEKETRLEFIKKYAEDSGKRLNVLKAKSGRNRRFLFLIPGESKGGIKAPLPGPGEEPCTERPDL